MTEDTSLRESPCQTYIEWTIKKFADLPTKDDYFLKSPHFSLSDTKWDIWIYPNGEMKDETVGWIGLYLMGIKLEKEYEVQCTVGMKKADGSILTSVCCKKRFNKRDIGWGSPLLFQRSTLLSSKDILAPDGSLTVFCTAHVGDGMEIEKQTSRDGTATLSENLKDLYISRRFTDATIVVQGREFLAHRNILATRSTVFSSMFENDMTEKISGRVEIADCDPDSFEAFLLFLYTGKLDVVSSENALSLYKTADKYDLQELKEECVFCMSRELSVDSVCNVVHLAATHNDPDLLKAATEFFIGNVEAIIKTIKWQSFMAENFSLGNELFLKLLESKKKSSD